MKNYFTIKTKDENICSYNEINNDMYLAAINGVNYTSKLYIGNNYSSNITPIAPLLTKPMELESNNFDISKGELFLSKSVLLNADEINGQAISDLGLINENNTVLYNRSVIKDENGANAFIKNGEVEVRLTIFLDILTSANAKLCAGENKLVSYLFGLTDLHADKLKMLLCIAGSSLDTSCQNLNIVKTLGVKLNKNLVDMSLEFSSLTSLHNYVFDEVVITYDNKPILKATSNRSIATNVVGNVENNIANCDEVGLEISNVLFNDTNTLYNVVKTVEEIRQFSDNYVLKNLVKNSIYTVYKDFFIIQNDDIKIYILADNEYKLFATFDEKNLGTKLKCFNNILYLYDSTNIVGAIDLITKKTLTLNGLNECILLDIVVSSDRLMLVSKKGVQYYSYVRNLDTLTFLNTSYIEQNIINFSISEDNTVMCFMYDSDIILIKNNVELVLPPNIKAGMLNKTDKIYVNNDSLICLKSYTKDIELYNFTNFSKQVLLSNDCYTIDFSYDNRIVLKQFGLNRYEAYNIAFGQLFKIDISASITENIQSKIFFRQGIVLIDFNGNGHVLHYGKNNSIIYLPNVSNGNISIVGTKNVFQCENITIGVKKI